VPVVSSLALGKFEPSARIPSALSLPWKEAVVRSHDAVVIATHHEAFDLNQISAWASLIVDTRDAMKSHAGLAIVLTA
jgi:UDP-N-acetyl-D-mannosaminuronate dehydrogenase